jgi:hypothetical protein
MDQFQMLIRLYILTTCFDGLWDPQWEHRQHFKCVISQVGSGCLKPLLAQTTGFDKVLPVSICFVTCDLNFSCGKFIDTSLTN